MSESNYDAFPVAPGAGGSAKAASTEIAERMLQVYQARNRLLGADLFHAPAWEILLLLETAERGLDEFELVHLMNAAPATLQRWIEVLEARALVAREQDGGRSAYVLTATARADLAEVLLSARRKPGPDA